MSPQAQQAFDASLGAQSNIAKTAQGLSSNLASQLGQPLDWSAQLDMLNGITAQNLDRSWDRQSQMNETDLINRGIRPGSSAYQQATTDFRNDRSMAYNNANAANFGLAQQSAYGARNQAINELSGLLGAGQVQTPQFGGTPTTDIAGIVQGDYANRMSQYNANQGLLGGLFGAGANLLSLSDRRAKTDIKRIGQTDTGVPIYQFRYKHGGPTQIGYMAQDLLETHPEAVSIGPDGFYRVQYEKVA